METMKFVVSVAFTMSVGSFALTIFAVLKLSEEMNEIVDVFFNNIKLLNRLYNAERLLWDMKEKDSSCNGQ